MKINTTVLKIAVVVSLLLNICLSVFIFTRPELGNNEQANLPYLSKRVFLEDPNDILINFVPLRTKLRSFLDTKPNVSIYFEYLPSGTSIGINDTTNFAQASLVKVPVAMAIYKQIENGQLNLGKTLELKNEHLDNQFGELWKKGEGAQITVEQAVLLSLIESDNTATKLLISILPLGFADQVYDYLDIPKQSLGNMPIISAKNYSSIFRSLYLAAYLTEENSNEILDILTRTKFNDKLPAAVPTDIKIAHKVGEFEDQKSNKSVYSDCGIVFLPKRTYNLCIMVSDSTEADAASSIQQTSKIVFEYVHSVNR